MLIVYKFFIRTNYSPYIRHTPNPIRSGPYHIPNVKCTFFYVQIRLIPCRRYTWVIQYVIQYSGGAQMCAKRATSKRKSFHILFFLFSFTLKKICQIYNFIIARNRIDSIWREKKKQLHTRVLNALRCLLCKYDTSSRSNEWFFFLCTTHAATVSSSASPSTSSPWSSYKAHGILCAE